MDRDCPYDFMHQKLKASFETNKGQEKRNSSNFLKKLLKFFIKVLLTILVIALN